MFVNQVLAAEVAGGGYVSIAKIVPALLILLLWARLMTWADKDAVAAHLPRTGLNLGMLGGLVLAYTLFFWVPFYFVALPIVVVVFAAEVGVYLYMRNQVAGLGDLRKQFERWLASFSKKKSAAMAPGQIGLFSKSGVVDVPEGDSPDRPAYDAVQLALTDPLKKHAEQIDMDGRGENGLTVKYTVDGVSYTGRVIDPATGSAAIGYLKGIAGLDVEDRRKPQTGQMRVGIDARRHDLKVQTAGSTAGEYMRLIVDPKKKNEYQLADLGFTEKQLATVKEIISDNKGVVLLSAPKSMGLTSLCYGILRGHDAFLQHIQTVERDPEQDLDGITQNKLAANATGAEELKTTDWVISQEADVVFINKIEDPKTAASLIAYAQTGKRVYVAFRAVSTFDALNQWRKLVGDDALALGALKLVINGRVIRRLCNNCKVAYNPEPGTLRKLGMNPDKSPQLYQARTEPIRDQKGNPVVCEFCQDLRYKGRTGVFELMVIDSELREAVAAGRPVEQVFRRQRGRFLQEEALGMVEKGETSVQEVKRVLKPDAGADSSAPDPSTAAPPPPTPRRASAVAPKA